MKTISEYSNEIEKGIVSLSLPNGKYDSLYEPIRYAMSAGGKRLRPILTLMGTDAFGDDFSKAMNAALGLEMFHNFTLLHDDVMDNSDTRRGRPTVHKKYDSNTAILSGDTMLTLATELISDVDDSILRNVLETFNSMAIKVYEGQRLDMDFEKCDIIDMASYLEMIEEKTGALLGASVKIGAMIGNADDKDVELMYSFGVDIGIAFQIQDDYLDTFGDPLTFGKPIGGDINNYKKTFLYIAALTEGGKDAEALKAAYEIPAGEMRVKTVTRIYEKLGIDDKCKKTVGNYLAKALKALNETSLPEDKKEYFRKFAEKLIGRKK